MQKNTKKTHNRCTNKNKNKSQIDKQKQKQNKTKIRWTNKNAKKYQKNT